MKKFLVIALVIFGASSFAFSQTQNKPSKTNKVEQQLIQLMTDWGDLSGRRDTTAIARMLPDDITLSMPDGVFLTKAQYLEGFKNIPADFTLKDSDQQARVFGNAAIVTARYVVTAGGKTETFRYTTTFIKRQGRWQPVAFQGTRLAQQ
ncbi:MAG TPA: nuclear transport factor 2 family protein [Pyrinomonadaceae bacterium]|jgi:ketosteroid isomerase-like protein